MKRIEVTGPTVAEAVEQALAQLQRDRDEVLIEVLQQDEQQARVRVTDPDADDGDAADEVDVAEADDEREAEVSVAPAPAQQRRRREPDGDPVAIAREVLEQTLLRMEIHAFVTPERTTAPGVEGGVEETITLHVEGTDEEMTGLLIGRRGETLQSLQYLINLIVNRRTGKWPQLVIDVGNYRQRRRDSLEGLARRMAERVRMTGHPLPLEPMNSFERRIVHLALRENPDVYTESAGEGEGRKIIIYPSKKS